MINIEATNISKRFNQKLVFKDISFKLSLGECLGITGNNGTGKSTLLKILAGLLTPSSGTICLLKNDKEINSEKLFHYLGFVSPYLNLYDEFTALENLKIFDEIRGTKNSNDRYSEILNIVNLYNRRNEMIGIYSSGMKQRLKYAFALINNPDLLLLDEPMSNLDQEGVDMVNKIIEKFRKNRIIIIATNESADLRHCNKIINLNS